MISKATVLTLLVIAPVVLFGQDKLETSIKKEDVTFDLSNKFFIQNNGQLKGEDSEKVNFYYSNSGVNVYLTENGISYQFNEIHKPQKVTELLSQSPILTLEVLKKISKLQEKAYLETHRIDLELINLSDKIKIKQVEIIESPIHYYTEKGLFSSKPCRKIIYKNVYPFIDWVVYINDKGGIKYDFIIHPNGNPKDIKFKINWADDIKVTLGGTLKMSTSMGVIEEEKPSTFQENRKIESKFSLEGNILSYDVSAYDKTKKLIIDPAVIWATYYGGSGEERRGKFTTAVDGSNNVYLAGTTESTSAIASGGHQNTYGGGGFLSGDAFLAKFDGTGTRLWATYYGGTDDEYGNGCAVDGSNNVYLAGTTKSTGAIASGGHQNTYAGGSQGDAFLVKFNSAGVRQWATYYGGTSNDLGNGCAVDLSDNVYLVGWTQSNSGIGSGGHQNAISSSREHAFLVKFNSAGVRQWGTYYGDAPSPTTWTYGNGVVCDGSNNVYLGGAAFGTSTISSAQTTVATAGAHQTQHTVDIIDQYDAFLVKFNSAGVRQWGTYYGGTDGDEYGYNVAVDGTNNIYLAGSARSTNGVGSGGHQNTFGGGSNDAFLVKFNSSGVRQWGTYYGGTGTDVAGNVSISGSDLYLSGTAGSSSAIASGGFDNTYDAGDAFIVRFDLSGVRQWGSYFGGSSTEEGHFSAVDGNGDIFLSGYTFSNSGVSLLGHQNTYGGGSGDAFLVKISNNPCGACVLSGSGTVWTWTGCQSTDWFNPCNWDRQTVPNTTSNVIVPNTINKPLITGATANCFDITIQSSTGAQLDLNSTGGGILNIVKP